MNNINWLLVLIVIVYVIMVVFTMCVINGMCCDLDNGAILMSILWPIFWALVIIVVVLNPLCRFGVRIGRWINDKLVDD